MTAGEQGTFREVELEGALRTAYGSLKYAVALLRNLLYEKDAKQTLPFFKIRLREIEHDLNPCEETRQALDAAIAEARLIDNELIEERKRRREGQDYE